MGPNNIPLGRPWRIGENDLTIILEGGGRGTVGGGDRKGRGTDGGGDRKGGQNLAAKWIR